MTRAPKRTKPATNQRELAAYLKELMATPIVGLNNPGLCTSTSLPQTRFPGLAFTGAW